MYAALLYNANVKGFATGKIYQGVTKNLCVPGLNCYSCPGAVGACPLGSLQNALASSKTSSLAYVFGIFVLLGLLLGRTICGFLCPFGLVQELLHKIPTPKLKKSRATRVFSYFKYVILVGLVILVPLAFSDKLAVPGFCKYICPDGTLFGAVSLLVHPDNADMFGMLGPLFTWKFCLLVVFLLASVFIFRFFCRFFCPLGAIYGFFCRLALIGVKLDKQSCIQCGLCVTTCKMDIRHVGDHECIHCGQCIPVCPTKAIHWSGSKYFIADPTAGIGQAAADASETDTAAAEARAKARAKTLKRRRTVLQAVAAILAVALLGTAIWYYNFRGEPDADVTGTETETTPAETESATAPVEPDSESEIETAADTDTSDVLNTEFASTAPDTEPETTAPVNYGYEVGNMCPDFTVPLIGSEGSFSLAEHRGRITVINFWASWCGPCKHELPDFERLASEYAGLVDVVAISTDANASGQASARDYVSSGGFSSVQFAFDASDACEGDSAYNTIAQKSMSLPVTVILDQGGQVIFRTSGSMSYEKLLGAIADALLK